MKLKWIICSATLLVVSAASAETVVQCDYKKEKSAVSVSAADPKDVVVVQAKQTGSSGYQWFSNPELPFTIENPEKIGAYSIKSFSIKAEEQTKPSADYVFVYKRSFDPATKPALATCTVTVVTTAVSTAPKCVNVGSKSEGWKLPDGKVMWDNCANKVSYCSAIGSRSEGWYSAEVAEKKLLGFDSCSKSEDKKPVCVHIGTRSEGWQTPNGKLLWDQCSEKVAKCMAVGSRSEGWYAVKPDKNTSRLIVWDHCSGK